MVMDHHQHRLSSLRTSLSMVVAPIQYLVDKPVQFVGWVGSSFSSRQSLIEENNELRKEQLFLNAQVQKLLALEKENSELYSLLQSSSHAGGKVLAARILAVSSDPFVRQVVLDKGKKHHLYVGQPVLDENGVMGQVIEVGPWTSQVLLLTDTRSAIPIQDNRNGLRGITASQYHTLFGDISR